MLGGIYTGQISFYEKEDVTKYVWYTICVNTERPQKEKTVELTAHVRKAVAFEVQLNNPLDEPVIFEVIVEGEGLVGDPVI